MKREVTERQKELLSIIYQYIKDTGYPPTFEEMRGELNVTSNQSVIDLLHKLEEGGLLKKEEGTARGIVIKPLGYQILGVIPLVPFAGITSAGAPLETVEIHGEWQPLSPEVASLKENIFLLKISGDSMINAGINDGDIVLVQSKKEFISGEIVLARIGDGATVKRFISDDKPPYTYLKPENPNHDIILFTDQVELVGKVISVLKDSHWRPVE